MSVRTRFAPSPTGFLHIGGARTALYNWLYAKRHGGKFILRVEDTDAERSTAESMQVILDGLQWLGLEWDEGPGVDGDFGPYYQSERVAIYDRYLAKLAAAGHVYEDDGAIRFRVPDKTITVSDQICGEVSTNLKEQGSRRYNPETKQEEEANPDIVIKRPNGGYIFHFVNVVDDIEMGITHVIRGEDHLSNTPKHLALFEAFGVTPPTFAHIPLNLNPSGTKMSKRDQGALIHEYQESGFLPDAVNNYMALLGWSAKDDQEIFSMKELKERFDLSGVNKSNSKFDYDKCKWVNGEHLRHLPSGELQAWAGPFLSRAGLPAADERVPAALELTRDRAQLLSEIPGVIATIFETEVAYDEASLAKVAGQEDIANRLAALINGLASSTGWDELEIKAAITAAAEGIGVKMGALMLPCRVGVMGSTSGADLVPVLVLLGQAEVVRRLKNFATKLN
ncbi:MAG: glutamate--tRNA ligase family protein [Verrucomicrobiales bacterium]|nr:glutamate--tRNA ligase family protein [Verrucomicrobiales bacterium]